MFKKYEFRNIRDLLRYMEENKLLIYLCPESRDKLLKEGELIMRNEFGYFFIFEKVNTPDGIIYCVTEKYEIKNYENPPMSCLIC